MSPSLASPRGRQIHVGLDAHGLHPVSRTWIDAQVAEILISAAQVHVGENREKVCS
ncbi:hypothetical protein AB0H71_25335 [Nocardia sp. NPDC050697]|uniref:hypothetical protein n=1 Tax=Nocardia sp. NPDC050697 TaxID=3155158 RepID=UPI0033FCE490